MARGAGQGRAGPSQGLAFLAVVLTLFFLRTFRSGAETNKKVKPPPDWALPPNWIVNSSHVDQNQKLRQYYEQN